MSERESFPGGCLCGAVRYVARGPLRDVLICHCVDCRRFHGGPGAYTALPKDDLELVADRGLRWRASPESDAAAERGFCGEWAPASSGRPRHARRSAWPRGRSTVRPAPARTATTHT